MVVLLSIVALALGAVGGLTGIAGNGIMPGCKRPVAEGPAAGVGTVSVAVVGTVAAAPWASVGAVVVAVVVGAVVVAAVVDDPVVFGAFSAMMESRLPVKGLQTELRKWIPEEEEKGSCRRGLAGT